VEDLQLSWLCWMMRRLGPLAAADGNGQVVQRVAARLSPTGSRVELYAAIRRDARAGLSNRALQRNRVGYRTVAAALASGWPKSSKPPPKRRSRLDPYLQVIDDWLRDDLDAPRKQRPTATQIFDRLLDEHDAAEVSYWMVREYVSTRRREIRIEAGREPTATFIPQEHLPGREAEVDFGEVAVRLRFPWAGNQAVSRPVGRPLPGSPTGSADRRYRTVASSRRQCSIEASCRERV
jgi:hypothetical protein